MRHIDKIPKPILPKYLIRVLLEDEVGEQSP